MLTFKAKILGLLLILIGFSTQAQTAWTWTQKEEMPFANANNAVTEGEMGGNMYVYSFGGIDTTKIYSGINKRAFRYDVTNDVWDEIDTLPVVLPLVASSANTVKNKIYILGGYHVYSNGNETSSDEVIIYDPETNTYEPNGTPIPVPIDDQAQMVWRDSLIYVVTGWSNSGNVPNVQIYDPALDQWQVGTDLPNSNYYKAFGSSGYIIGDTIFYHGGASTGFNFPANKFLRKGVIDANDPTQITWTQEEDAPVNNYRSACVAHGINVFWIGGSSISYNYNGVAYNGSGGVEPTYAIARYETQYQDWYEGSGAPYGVMDLRGVGKVDATSWIICGGMEDGQQVSKRTFLLEYDPVTGGVFDQVVAEYKIVNRHLEFYKPTSEIKLIGLDGKLNYEFSDYWIPNQFSGVFILQFVQDGRVFNEKIKLD